VLPPNLAVGAPWSGTIAVTLNGHDRWRDVGGTVPVSIELVTLPPLEPAQLFYSDDPEKVLGDQAGVLFRAALSADAPTARLYAYHEFTVTGRRLYALLRSAATSHVQFLGAVAGPSDPTYTGHVLTVHYLQARRTQQSVIATLDADPVLLEIGNPSKAAEVLSGIYDFRLIDGGPVDVVLVAGFDSGDPDPVALIDAPPPAKDTSDRAGVYPLGAVAPIMLSASILDAKYSKDPRYSKSPGMFAVVGLWAMPPVAGKRYLGGDYGLVRPFRLTMTNVTDQPGTIYLYEAPSKGGGTITLFFDGGLPTVFERPVCLQAPQDAPAFRDRYLLKAFTIPPTRGGAAVIVTGEYMTDGGSSYPVELGLSLDTPLPLPPPKTMCVGSSPSPAPSASPTPAPVASP
jgi:hypothetical protein